MMRSCSDVPSNPKVPRRCNGSDIATACIAAGQTHQGSSKYKGTNSQCTVMAACASICSVLRGRETFSSSEIDQVLEYGDKLYMELKHRLPAGITWFMADELPTELRVGNDLVQIGNMMDNWIANSFFPNSPSAKRDATVMLANLLKNEVFNDVVHNDATDSILFTGQGQTLSFWRHDNLYYLFNSHAVNEKNLARVIKPHDPKKTKQEAKKEEEEVRNYVARLFRCGNLLDLASLLLARDYYDGTQYSLSRLRVVNGPIQISHSTLIADQFPSLNVTPSPISQSILAGAKLPLLNQEPSPMSQSILAGVQLPSFTPIPSPMSVKNTPAANSPMSQSILAGVQLPSFYPISPLASVSVKNTMTANKNSVASPEIPNSKPVVVVDKKLLLKPVVLLEPIKINVVVKNKGGRPKKQKRGRKPTKENAHLDAVKKYNEKHPQVNREAVQRYTEQHPEVHRKAVQQYTEQHPEVHRKAVQQYTEQHPEVHREAVQRFTEQHPEVHREAVQRYTEQHPEVHREAVQRYTEQRPEVNREAVQRYTEQRPEVHREAVRRYDELHPDVNQNSVRTYSENSRNIDPPLRRSTNLIGEKRGTELDSVPLFSLKNTSLLSRETYRCQHCRSPLFEEEKSRRQWCCHSGDFIVQNFPPLDEDFYEHPSFLRRPRAYNNLFSFSALGVSHGFQEPENPRGIYFLKIQGRIYHRVFDLSYHETPNNINFYINDNSEREDLAAELSLDRQVIRMITGYMHDVNPYIDCFRRLNLEPSSEAFIKFEKTSRSTHGNILGDQPIGQEIAAIISTDREQITRHCIAFKKVSEDRPRTVDILHPLYEPFQYPLLYPHGNKGWDKDMKDNRGNVLSQVKYYRCLLLSEPRFSIFNRLSEEWLVDMYCRTAEERLRFLEREQKKNQQNALRVAPLNELLEDEFILGEGGIVPGRIYLPSSFTGGPRYMKVKYMDAIAIVNRMGPPSYFLTFTCNPRWPEIKDSLLPNRTQNPLICARVFNLKLAQLIRDLKSGKWFGRIVYMMHVIEFQKRGLPHAHIAFRVEGGGPKESSDIDKFVNAVIPDPSEVLLHKAVLAHMIHGPCGPSGRTDLPCWDSEKQQCLKHFPKKETPVTFCDDRGFVNYRRDSKNEATIKHGRNDVTINDLWVVPYNSALLLKYDAHINLEISTQLTIIKYLFKYMTKGPDEARVAIVDENHRNNEIEQYVTKRYIGSSDAAWRILEFDVMGREPTVKQLAVHLPDRHSVFFRPGQVGDAIDNASSDLLNYFSRPLTDEFDRLTYLDYYENYNIHAKDPHLKSVQAVQLQNGKFVTKRVRGELIARLFWVAPNRGEQFYLRMLLNVYPCRSFEDLIQLGGPTCTTFQEAAKAVGLANDEVEYERVMEEASTFYTGPRLRRFFVLLAVNGAPVASLWDTYKRQLAEDILHRMPGDEENAFNVCLVQIDRMLRRHGTSLAEQGLPEVIDRLTELDRERTEYDLNSLRSYVEEWLPQLSLEQRAVFDYVNRLCVDSAFRETNNSAIFVDGPAGTGKTLLLNVISAHTRTDLKGVVLNCASSAIAAHNYPNATTAHSLFKFPLDVEDDRGYWSITNGSQRAELIYNADVIVYDEAPMAHKYLIHLLDRSLQDLMGSDKIFGGKIIIFAGDFRQIPPVVLGARTNSDILNASLKTSPIWQQLKQFKLETSQRCREDPEYADFLLKLGSNELPPHRLDINNYATDLYQLDSIDYVTELDDLIDFVFPNVVIDEPGVCSHRAILCTRNDAVREINTVILDRVPGDILHFYAVDKMVSENTDEVFLGPEFLHTLRPQGVPDYDLQLKIDCVCIITRNISFADGLLNGTKVIIVEASPHLIKVRKQGSLDEFLIPRILFKAPIHRNSPYEMVRRQFPLQVCYAMTIHKSQGQTISRVGVDLRSDVFSHGQLYVALGRVREKRHIKVLLPSTRIDDDRPFSYNHVIPELLN